MQNPFRSIRQHAEKQELPPEEMRARFETLLQIEKE
jgi:hypothetical protein